jgi:hypothetical protein
MSVFPGAGALGFCRSDKNRDHRMIFDVNNRGNLTILRSMNNALGSNDPSQPAHAGNGFLMKEGFNHRFGQNTNIPLHFEFNYLPGDFFLLTLPHRKTR